jgi:hypothetical protein
MRSPRPVNAAANTALRLVLALARDQAAKQ